MSLTCGSLFAGIGGFDIAAEALGWRTCWFVEWDPHCQFWLAEHFPGRPIYGDITKVDFAKLERVDVLCGGFPCPPVSAAGRRKGADDDRWLWPEFVRAIRALRPRYVTIENVPGLLSTRDRANGGQPLMGTVLGDLAELGYNAEWFVLSAADVGAPQERKRVWIVAYANGEVRGADERESVSGSEYGHDVEGCGAVVGDGESGGRGTGEGIDVRRAGGGCAPVGESSRERSQRDGRPVEHAGEFVLRSASLQLRPWVEWVDVAGADGSIRRIPAAALHETEDTRPELSVRPVADGLPGRVARLKAVGNAVVPLCALHAFDVIRRRERG